MRTLFAVLAIGMMSFAVTGCKNKDHHHDDTQRMSATDQCSHCPGTQTLSADGTCPGCKMKMK